MLENKHLFSYKGALAISLAAIMWGIDGVLLTPNLFNLDVPFVVMMLHLLPFTFMAIFLYKQFGKLRTFTRSQFILLIFIALLGGCVGTQAIVKALFLVNFKHLTAVVMIQKLQPIFAILLATIFLKEKLSNRFLLWASLAIVSGYFMTFGFALPDFETGSNTILASMFALLAAFAFGSNTVLGKKATETMDFKTATFYRYMFTSIIMIVWVAIVGDFNDFRNITAINWTMFALIGLTTGSGAVLLFYYGIKRVPAVVSTICELLFPITALLLDYFVHDVHLSVVQIIAVCVMVFSIIMINLKKSK